MEEWKNIDGYKGLYQVSNKGRVRRMAKFKETGEMYQVRIMRLCPDYNGKRYRSVGLSMNNKQTKFAVHRLVAIAFIPNPNNLCQVNHKDAKPHNNKVENLEWVTPKENTHHAISLGLKKRNGFKRQHGESNGFSKLTNEQVLEIRKLYAEGGHTYHSLGAMFNCNFSTIGYIIQRKRWAHI